MLTEAFVQLVAGRLAGATAGPTVTAWPVDRIASTYELIASLVPDHDQRRAAAFVAGTAHQIIARRDAIAGGEASFWTLNREAVEPGVAAALLFLAAEQYADAQEAASRLVAPSGAPYDVVILFEHIRDMASGDLTGILDRATRWRRPDRRFIDLQSEALGSAT